MPGYYRATHPDIFPAQESGILKTAATLEEIYQNNFFPEMKVRWDMHPTNIGHLFQDGCFRCKKSSISPNK